jgi:hypothetical protein
MIYQSAPDERPETPILKIGSGNSKYRPKMEFAFSYSRIAFFKYLL